MAHRQFKDAHGRTWDAWTVIPERAERRSSHADADIEVERERRVKEDPEFRVPLGPQWTNGWLAFETKGEKRRLAPIPESWESMNDEDIAELCERAQLVTPSRRLAE